MKDTKNLLEAARKLLAIHGDIIQLVKMTEDKHIEVVEAYEELEAEIESFEEEDKSQELWLSASWSERDSEIYAKIVSLSVIISAIKKNEYMDMMRFRGLMEIGIPIFSYIRDQGKGISADIIYEMVREGKISYSGVENFLNEQLCKAKLSLSKSASE